MKELFAFKLKNDLIIILCYNPTEAEEIFHKKFPHAKQEGWKQVKTLKGKLPQIFVAIN